MRDTTWSMLGVLLAICFAAFLWAADTPPSKIKAARQQRREAISRALTAKDFDKALGLLEELGNDPQATANEKFAALYYQFDIQAKQKHDGAKAAALAKKISETHVGSATTLNYLAWTMLDTPGLKTRDLDLALDLARKAAETSKNEDPQVLDTLARAWFEKGDLDRAIAVQTMAVEKSPLVKTLEKYKALRSAGKAPAGKRPAAARK